MQPFTNIYAITQNDVTYTQTFLGHLIIIHLFRISLPQDTNDIRNPDSINLANGGMPIAKFGYFHCTKKNNMILGFRQSINGVFPLLEVLHSVYQYLVTEVSRQPIIPIFMVQALQEELHCLTLEFGNDWLFRNVGN